MPQIASTDLAIRALKPTPGKQVTYLDKSLKGFGVRITEKGAKMLVLVYGEERKRVTRGTVGIIKLSVAREKAKDILADRQINATNTPIALTQALDRFMKGYAEKNKPSTVKETERMLRRHLHAPVMLLVRRQRSTAAVGRAGLQPRQLHADAGLAQAVTQWSLTSPRRS